MGKTPASIAKNELYLYTYFNVFYFLSKVFDFDMMIQKFEKCKAIPLSDKGYDYQRFTELGIPSLVHDQHRFIENKTFTHNLNLNNDSLKISFQAKIQNGHGYSFYYVDNLKKEYHVGFMYSPAMLAKNINKALNDQTSGEGKFPTAEEYEDVKKQLTDNKKNKDLKRIITIDGKYARISGKMCDVGSYIVKEQNIHFEEFIKSHINSNDIEIKITGAAHLMDRNNEYMVTNMAQGFLFSIIEGLTINRTKFSFLLPMTFLIFMDIYDIIKYEFQRKV